MGENQDIFHVLKTDRPMRRLKPDPVPQALLQEILDAASCAPNSLNTQPYESLVVRDTATKTLFGEHYHTAMQERLTPFIPADDDNSRHVRNFRGAFALGKLIKDVPVCFSFAANAIGHSTCLKNSAPGSPRRRTIPCPPVCKTFCSVVEQKGLGASLTTMHQVSEAEMIELLSIPVTHGIVAVLPIRYPEGNFGPLRRKPSVEKTYLDRWGTRP